MAGSRTDSETAILAALVALVAQWSTDEVQREAAAAVGVRLDATAVRAVYLLGLDGGSAQPSTLAEQLHLSRPTTSKLLARLDAEGLIESAGHATDGRARQVRLSAAGRDAYEALLVAGQRMVNDAVADWSADELTAFRDHLVRFSARVRPPGGASAPSPPASSQKEQKK